MKALLIIMHVVFGVSGTVMALIALHYLKVNKWKAFKTFSFVEFLVTCISFITGGIYYLTDYQKDKLIILAGDHPWAHSLFMEVKEHLFLSFFLLSLFLQLRLAFTNYEQDIEFRKESQTVLKVLVATGLVISFMGFMISMGFRVTVHA
jgi:hypothetical protein